MKLTPPRVDAPMVEHALYWASRGWAVFPLWWPIDGLACGCGQTHEDSGKHPILRNGFKGGSCEPEVIRGWWAEHPLANIGSTPPAGQVVIDVDGPLDSGIEFPETQTHSTGKGLHLVYINNMSRPLEQTQSSGRYWTNVDTRVSGKGYVVLPPSLHKNGTRYALTNGMAPVEFPDSMVPAAKKRQSKARLNADSEIVRLLTMPRDHAELGDDAMSRVAGWVARYAPDLQHFDALLSAINAGLAEPLHPVALAKKRGIWDKHQAERQESVSRAIDDEGRGWLFELGDVGYSTPIDSRDSVEYVPWSDFRVTAKGLIVLPDNQVWIVDFLRADGSVLEGQRLSAHILASTTKLRDWLARRGMVLHDNRADKRSAHGVRLLKLMQSQNPPVWKSRDFYGWCVETNAFLTPDGEVTSEGLRQFTGVYPEDELVNSSPLAFVWDADLDQARGWLRRVLALQEETESVKIGAWLMMLLLRGQWQGILPGVLVQASAGVGKTVFWQLLSRIAGSTNDGERMTVATARDVLTGNSSGFVWLDDVATTSEMEELIRKAVTQGKLAHKVVEDGRWRTTYKYLRGSVVISGEGSDFYRQKAQRDRFVEVEFSKSRKSSDAVKLQGEDIGRGSGVLLQEVLRHADLLGQLESLMADVTDRDKQAQTTLRMGGRILDAVLVTGDHYTKLIDGWFFGSAVELDKGEASEVVLEVLPSIWRDLGLPQSSGRNGLIMPLWYDTTNHVFWVNAGKVADYWLSRKGVNERQRQLTTKSAITKELDACGASKSQTKRVPAEYAKGIAAASWTPSYRSLPDRYSRLILDAADVHLED